ncbi:hypothetical protein AAZX31_02G134700 [Glycine max]
MLKAETSNFINFAATKLVLLKMVFRYSSMDFDL